MNVDIFQLCTMFLPTADARLSLTHLPLQASSVQSCHVVSYPEVIVMITAVVNRLHTVSPLVKLIYTGLEGCVQSQFGVPLCLLLGC